MKIYEKIGMAILWLIIIFVAWFALSVCFESLHNRIASRQTEWRERVDGGIEQNIESPPRRTASKSIKRGDVSKED